MLPESTKIENFKEKYQVKTGQKKETSEPQIGQFLRNL